MHTLQIKKKKSECRFVNKSLLKANSTPFYDARLFGAMLCFHVQTTDELDFYEQNYAVILVLLANIFRNKFRFSWETALQLHRHRKKNQATKLKADETYKFSKKKNLCFSLLFFSISQSLHMASSKTMNRIK